MMHTNMEPLRYTPETSYVNLPQLKLLPHLPKLLFKGIFNDKEYHLSTI